MQNLASSNDPIDAAAEHLRHAARTDRRAQLAALMPLIDSLVRQRLSYQAIAKALSEAGLAYKPASVRQAVWRWRRRQSATDAAIPASDPAPASPPAAAAALPTHISPAPRAPTAAGLARVNNKADLVQLRKHSQIDMNLLAEAGRRK